MANQDFLLKYQSLPESLQQEVADFIEFLLEKYASQKGTPTPSKQQPKAVRKAGTLKGLVSYMAEDFDAPLEDFKDYM